ncbi:hypothetical protein [Solilutibacter silvestris]|uniref:hypothetical protein n=1 Tax=Solilutibacter silvestris TaxID=1645665 RepID=UPI000CA08908|nr:hypothetical protein [Lysobacter silvestris]
MKPHVFFWPAVAYVLIYVYLANKAVKSVRPLLDDYEKVGKAEELLGWKRSISAVRLMLDSSLPRESFPEDVKKKIERARFFFYTAPIVCVICWLLMVFFSD